MPPKGQLLRVSVGLSFAEIPGKQFLITAHLSRSRQSHKAATM
jgi:hypothetical protein